MCIVKGLACTEHRINSKNYSVVLHVNEKTGQITKLVCSDCAASSGGCKHSIAFLFWVHRRLESPSPTEVECYWKKSKLADVGSEIKFKGPRTK